ncbi:unnamed protein product [Microthlaspi erraticum]|uniref:Retrotransposon Copia-like N-terminal domain-containing protein n=1 Tax=Microthlaspi erraticum TaxID=1685480 RepID=A0A6D2J4E6_9BRAS|nr:unnamed protein product [Microthlaspi erraticum]
MVKTGGNNKDGIVAGDGSGDIVHAEGGKSNIVPAEGGARETDKMTLSPFYLHPSDGPGNLITTVQLKGENYEDWAKHVRNALRTKRKLGFVDGTMVKPTTDGEIEQWGVVNSMLVAWIMNTIEPSLRDSISMVDEVHELWEDLKLQFSAGNGPRISELRAEIANCRQGGDMVVVYYGKLKKMWDELAIYKPIRTCTCGELKAQLEEDREEERTNTFLTGLNSERYGVVRSTIQSIEPLPKLSQVYQLHCERRKATNNDQKYPDWWGERGRDFGERGRGGGTRGRFGREGGVAGRSGRGRGSPGRAYSAQIQSAGGAQANLTRQEGDYDRASLPQLSDEQWTSLLTFLSSKKQESNEKLNGKTNCGEFIIDTGASHHMTWNLDLLHNITDIHPCAIGLPDGDSAIATKQGDLCLGGDLWLKGMLYSKELTCSLISVAKVLKIIKGSITFTDELCVLQDRTSKMLIGAGEERGGVYVFRGVMGAKANKVVSSGSCGLWHQRLGHPSNNVLSYLSSDFGVGKQVESKTICEICLRAKQT